MFTKTNIQLMIETACSYNQESNTTKETYCQDSTSTFGKIKVRAERTRSRFSVSKPYIIFTRNMRLQNLRIKYSFPGIHVDEKLNNCYTMLQNATARKNILDVKTLLTQGANPNILSSNKNTSYRIKAIYIAIQSKNIELINLLITDTNMFDKAPYYQTYLDLLISMIKDKENLESLLIRAFDKNDFKSKYNTPYNSKGDTLSMYAKEHNLILLEKKINEYIQQELMKNLEGFSKIHISNTSDSFMKLYIHTLPVYYKLA